MYKLISDFNPKFVFMFPSWLPLLCKNVYSGYKETLSFSITSLKYSNVYKETSLQTNL